MAYGSLPNLSPGQFGAHDPDREAKLAAMRAEFGMDLPPEKEAYYSAAAAGQEHKDKMATMSVTERHEYMRGLREALKDGQGPKRGDLDNPLQKDMPKQPAARRQAAPRQPTPQQQVRAAMSTARKLHALSRKAKGRRR